ncbi:MAG: DUF484 family protein [Betaproteobacteria bacterium]|nr:DUF484 family protein [Betaproteobacteria bacterium]
MLCVFNPSVQNTVYLNSNHVRQTLALQPTPPRAHAALPNGSRIHETWLDLASAGQFEGQGDHHTPKPSVRKAFFKYLECGIFAHLFADSLKEPYGGANPGGEAAGWLDEPESLRSLALIALREAPGARAFGLLVIGSPDAQRFGRDMEVDFLMRMGQLASAALVRLRTPA